MFKCPSCSWVASSPICPICRHKADPIPAKPTWDDIFFNLADYISLRSDDAHTKIGCVIVDDDHTILSMGFNGLPRGIKPSVENLNRPFKYKYMEHAERNAIFNAKSSLKGSTLYVQMFPCSDCSRAIIQNGIKNVVVGKTQSTNPDWLTDSEASISILEEAGVNWRMQE